MEQHSQWNRSVKNVNINRFTYINELEALLPILFHYSQNYYLNWYLVAMLSISIKIIVFYKYSNKEQYFLHLFSPKHSQRPHISEFLARLQNYFNILKICASYFTIFILSITSQSPFVQDKFLINFNEIKL